LQARVRAVEGDGKAGDEVGSLAPVSGPLEASRERLPWLVSCRPKPLSVQRIVAAVEDHALVLLNPANTLVKADLVDPEQIGEVNGKPSRALVAQRNAVGELQQRPPNIAVLGMGAGCRDWIDSAAPIKIVRKVDRGITSEFFRYPHLLHNNEAPTRGSLVRPMNFRCELLPEYPCFLGGFEVGRL
jgi:hypothetical protein